MIKKVSNGELRDSKGNPYYGIYFVKDRIPYEGIDTKNTSNRLYYEYEFRRAVYNELNTSSIRKEYLRPFKKKIPPTIEQYSIGYFNRYFAQKKNDPFSTIVEIDEDQFFSGNINRNSWDLVSIRWYIVGNISQVIKSNENSIKQVKNFVGLSNFLLNLSEYRKDP